MRLAIVVVLAALAFSCEPPPTEPARPRRARVGWLETADGTIPLEALFDPNTRDERALAFRRTHDLSTLTAVRDLPRHDVEPTVRGGADY